MSICAYGSQLADASAPRYARNLCPCGSARFIFGGGRAKRPDPWGGFASGFAPRTLDGRSPVRTGGPRREPHPGRHALLRPGGGGADLAGRRYRALVAGFPDPVEGQGDRAPVAAAVGGGPMAVPAPPRARGR